MKTLVMFVGPPGCGKGTQAKNMVAEFGDIQHLVVSDLLLNDPRGKEAITQAVLAGNDVVNPVVRAGLKNAFKDTDVVLLDGGARTVNQARKIIELCEKEEYILHVISFTGFTDELLIARAHSRGRADDKKIADRLQQFQEDTAPAIRFLKGKVKSFHEIFATKKVDGKEVVKDAARIWDEVCTATNHFIKKAVAA